jgi:4-aminobutyrate aminotransferase/(S)-3-amino-2-methylpropionate transaminase
MFAIEHSGVEPDLVAVAKSMAGGFPLSGVIGRASLMDAIEPGGMGGTYGGSPVACAAALAVLAVFDEEALLERANRQGEYLRMVLENAADREDLIPIGNIRGLGAMVGFDILKERGSNVPLANGAKAIASRAFDEGLILLSCGAHGETIRILVPLTAPQAHLDEGMAALMRALGTY